MSDDRLFNAISRIERAIATLGQVAAAPAVDPELERRHAALQARTRDAIEALDQLIAETDD